MDKSGQLTKAMTCINYIEFTYSQPSHILNVLLLQIALTPITFLVAGLNLKEWQ
jgi:hypothetical protein